MKSYHITAEQLEEFRLKIVGWWEDYKCGCFSDTVKVKSDLPHYCSKHGYSSNNVYPELEKKKK